MLIRENYSLERHNTFRVRAQTRWFVEYETEAELERILRDEYFQECTSLHIGEGSNLLFVNNFDGIVVHSCIRGIEIAGESDDYVWLRIGASEHWDDVVAYAVSKGWGGIENLSHIPGETGAAAVQNIGAYGAEIGDVVETVEAYNQLTFKKCIFTNEDCGYAYRHSYFKAAGHDPYIVTHVTLRLQKSPCFRLDYGNLHEALDGRAVTLQTVRDTIVAVRSSKLPDTDTLGSAGSFFLNPFIPQQQFDELKSRYPDMPSYPAGDGRVKIAAGWLVEQCGWKGKRDGNVGVYEKQALVIVNFGAATGDEIAVFAKKIILSVKEKFGVELAPEVKYVE